MSNKTLSGAGPAVPPVDRAVRERLLSNEADAAWHTINAYCWKNCPSTGPHEAGCYDLRADLLFLPAAAPHPAQPLSPPAEQGRQEEQLFKEGADAERDALEAMTRDRDRWREALCDVLGLKGLITETIDDIGIGRSPGSPDGELEKGEWVAWDEEYHDEGCVSLKALASPVPIGVLPSVEAADELRAERDEARADAAKWAGREGALVNQMIGERSDRLSDQQAVDAYFGPGSFARATTGQSRGPAPLPEKQSPPPAPPADPEGAMRDRVRLLEAQLNEVIEHVYCGDRDVDPEGSDCLTGLQLECKAVLMGQRTPRAFHQPGNQPPGTPRDGTPGGDP